MSADALAELQRLGRKSRDCFVVEPAKTGVGGVDPLGLRQINFDLMNEVFPGLNNVARHTRPFTLVTWAWRRTIDLARERREKLPVSVHEDFVARVEVAFVWSMLQIYDQGDLELPGKQVVATRWGEAKRITFGDDDWKDFVKARRNSTALTAAINYGPGLRALRLLVDDANQPGVRVPGPKTDGMLDAFEARIAPLLGHKLFNVRGECTLKCGTAEEWAEHWDIDDVLDEERTAFRKRLMGGLASPQRRSGFELLSGVFDEEQEESVTRGAMCDGGDAAAAQRWHRVQVRQAFRLALESLFEWMTGEIGGGILDTGALATRLLEAAGGKTDGTAMEWLMSLVPEELSAVGAMEGLEATFATRAGLERAALSALAVALTLPEELQDGSHRQERLPLRRARDDLDRLASETPLALLHHIVEQWIIAQHTYWSVGRGLADARAGAKQILRLRLVLEPGGWRVTRGGGSNRMPRPTPDRLRTAVSLAIQSGLIEG